MVTYPETVSGEALNLGDVVQLFESGPYSFATVKNITNDNGYKVVHFFRPYTQPADFSSTGGVICYVGIEVFSEVVTGSRKTFNLWKKGDVK